MKSFDDLEVKQEEVQKPVISSENFIKRNLLKGITRQGKVYDAVEKWLLSFNGGITKKAFMQQMGRLDSNDDIAFEQLSNSLGKRFIKLPPPPKMPKLPKPLVEQMLSDLYVAVYGKKFKSAIKDAIKALKECGVVYVLPMEDLIIQFKNYKDKGLAPQMIDKAVEADFLFVVNFETPIHLEWHIREAIERIGRLREEKHRPIISTWNRYNDCPDFFRRFHIYIVE